MEIVTLDPTFEERTTVLSRAPALATLEGATVGLLSNGWRSNSAITSWRTAVSSNVSPRLAAWSRRICS